MISSTEKRDKLIEKIKKLLFLSKDGTNEHVAAEAARKVQQLLQEYNIDEGEISSDETKLVLLDVGYKTVSERIWEVRLLAELCSAYFCQALFNIDEMTVIGHKTDAQVTVDVYKSVRENLINLSYLRMQQYGEALKEGVLEVSGQKVDLRKLKKGDRPADYRRSWMDGTVIGVSQKIAEQKRFFQFKYGQKATALVVVRGQEIKKVLEDRGINKVVIGQMTSSNLGYSAGINDGKNTNLSRGSIEVKERKVLA